jgi:hypothetical protein
MVFVVDLGIPLGSIFSPFAEALEIVCALLGDCFMLAELDLLLGYLLVVCC